MRKGLTQNDVQTIRNSFLSFSPDNDSMVKVKHIIRQYENAYEMQSLECHFAGQHEVNFDQYYNVMSDVFIKRKTSMTDV